jgi:hypothetical protein
MQYVFVQHATDNTDANRGIEADNDGSDPGKDPQSNPMIANLTIIGNDFDGEDDSEGVYLREGTGAQIYNMVIAGTPGMGECLEVEGNLESQTHLGDGTITIKNSVMACTNGENFKDGSLPDGATHTIVNLEEWFTSEATNRVESNALLASDGSPLEDSPLLTLPEGAVDITTLDGFFEATDFVGAVGTSDWRDGWAFGFGGGTIDVQTSASGCPEGTTAVAEVVGNETTCQLSGRITSNLTLTEGNFYQLSGGVFVGGDNENSATLAIEPGVTVFGASGNDYLVVSRGSQIRAEGTKDKPITFTSRDHVVSSAAGAAGQWGGMVILGNAPSNKCPSEGDCSLQVEGVEEGAVFGGTNETDNSGVLQYVRVMHGGFAIAPDNELNGVTFGGVGSGTVVNYLQVHKNADDGVEFFGGNVDVKHLVLTDIQDDSIDWDNGYKGRIQYAVIRHATDNSDANRAIEADNDGSTPDKTPQSNPTLSNVTIIGNTFDGSDDSEGVYLREGTGAQLSNFIITGPAGMGECFEVEGSLESQTNLAVDDGTTTFNHSVLACENGENFKNGELPDGATHTIVDLETWFTSTMTTNAVAATQSLVLDGIYTSLDASVTVTPKDWSGDAFFDDVDFIGGVKESDDWTAGWTEGL